MRVELGTSVRCQDGELGELADIVVDPATRCVTHLVVQPLRSAVVGARLVPIELAEADAGQQLIALRCTREDFGNLDSVREFSYGRLDDPPVEDHDWDVGVIDVLDLPSNPAGDPGAALYATEVGLSYDRIPKDDVELRRSSRVRSSDGRDLGHVQALLVDEHDKLTHFVLQHRRIFARREVQIPATSIQEIGNDAVTIAFTREQVRALPAERPRRY
jgi:sporulation protein YlmC with PRC-barrel domain